jgi:hypothetical protein
MWALYRLFLKFCLFVLTGMSSAKIRMKKFGTLYRYFAYMLIKVVFKTAPLNKCVILLYERLISKLYFYFVSQNRLIKFFWICV